MPLLLSFLPLLLLLAVALVTDVRERRIPNWLNLLLVTSGLLNAAVWGAPTSLSQACLGLIVGFGILIIPFALGAMGGGDVKMLAGVGAWLGPIATIQVYAVAAIAGLVIVLVQCFENGRLTQLVRNSTLIVANFANIDSLGKAGVIASGQSLSSPSLRSVDKPLPYAVPTLIGVLVTIGMNLR